MRSQVGADLEISVARSKKGDREQGEEEAMKASTARANLLTVGQLPRQHGEAETPTFNQLPRVDQGRRLLGTVALRACPFAFLLGQARARLGPGGYYRHFGNRGP